MPPTTSYPSVIERYYTKYYDRREDGPSEDLCVLAHSNRVCIVTLTPNHKALSEGPIQSFNYRIESDEKKVSDVHGKRKHQAIKMKVGRPLCEITSGNGTKYVIRCPIRGKLCEINDKLVEDITLLQKMPETNGYLAVIVHFYSPPDNPGFTPPRICENLLTEEQYLNGDVIPARKIFLGDQQYDGDEEQPGVMEENLKEKDNDTTNIKMEEDTSIPSADTNVLTSKYEDITIQNEACEKIENTEIVVDYRLQFQDNQSVDDAKKDKGKGKSNSKKETVVDKTKDVEAETNTEEVAKAASENGKDIKDVVEDENTKVSDIIEKGVEKDTTSQSISNSRKRRMRSDQGNKKPRK